VPLSDRALAWLGTLSREEPMPVREVEAQIIECGYPPHEAWLDFHERFAGYFEEVGPNDVAVWGLARRKTLHVAPGKIWIRPPDRKWKAPAAINCADAFPEHGYELEVDGSFSGIGGPCPSFDMKLERHGLVHALYSRGRVERTLVTKGRWTPEHAALLESFKDAFVPEASDENMLFYARDKVVLEHVPRLEQLLRWQRVP
jgi:hypothetical protein